jgi:hypothetical protein
MLNILLIFLKKGIVNTPLNNVGAKNHLLHRPPIVKLDATTSTITRHSMKSAITPK